MTDESIVPEICRFSSIADLKGTVDNYLIPEIDTEDSCHTFLYFKEHNVLLIYPSVFRQNDKCKNTPEIKTQISNILKKGGKFILPRDDSHYGILKKTLRKYNSFELTTFGRRGSCNARLLYSEYDDHGWNVIARIEDIAVAYRVPFPQEYALNVSLGILLAVYHMGGDVRSAASIYFTCFDFTRSDVMDNVKSLQWKQDSRMQNVQKAFKGLKRISINDKSYFYEAVEAAEKNAWIAYFPFLFFWGSAASLDVYLAEDEGALSVYVMRRFGRDTLPSLGLFMPPMPLNEDTLNHAMQRLYDYNGERSATIMWLEEKEVNLIQRWPISKEMIFEDRHLDEFIYDPSIYGTLSGGRFKHMRKELHPIEKLKNVNIYNYEKKYEKSCLQLLEKWEETQGKKYKNLDDRIYTRYCLKHAHLFSENELFGIVVMVENEVKAFEFAGKIREDVGSFFISKYSPEIKGLYTFTSYRLLQKMLDFDTINNSYAIGEGMHFSKRMFRPVQMLKQFKAYMRKNV